MINHSTDEQLLEAENSYWTKKWERLERLHQNDDFKDLILEGYFKDKAVDGVSMLAHDSVIKSGKRGEIMESLVAISHLQDHFIMIQNLGSIPEYDEDES